MVAVPDQLMWELIKRNNSFLRKKNGHTSRTGTVTFSVEPGNLKSLNKYKYSGLAGSKAVDITGTTPDGEHKAQLIVKTASKCHTQPAKSKQIINIHKDFRRAESTIMKTTVNNYYRRDLKKAALGKYTKIYQANRRAKGIIKTIPIKKGRCKLEDM